MIDELLSEYTALEEELRKRREQLAATLRPKFHEAFAPFFQRHPKLEAIKFTAYTPYFNDGAECVYSVNNAELVAFGVNDICDYSARSISELTAFRATGAVPQNIQNAFDNYGNKSSPTVEHYFRRCVSSYFDLGDDVLRELGALAAEYAAIQAIVSSVPDDVMKGMIGDHVAATITAEGIEVDEYDHE